MDSLATVHRSKQNGLQLLRVLAALLVLIHHATAAVSGRYRGRVTPWDQGAFGVDLFFVLSGFVMVYSSGQLALLSNGWAVFAQRRLVRIVPMYWLATTVMVCAMVSLPRLFQRHGSVMVPALCSYLFVPSRDAVGGIHPLLVVGWTLNFEMFFYLLFTVALWLRVNVFLFLGILLGTVSATSLTVHSTVTAVAFYLDPIVLEFFLGMLLARINMSRAPWRLLLAGPILLVAGVIFLWPSALGEAWRPLRIGLPAAAIVWAFLALEPVFQRTPRPFLFLAEASYAIYLFHILLMPLLVRVIRISSSFGQQISLVLVCVLLSGALGSVLHFFVEAPTMSWFRKHWRLDGKKVIQAV